MVSIEGSNILDPSIETLIPHTSHIPPLTVCYQPVLDPLIYSLVRLVRPNTEELISRPFLGLLKIRWLLQDRMRT